VTLQWLARVQRDCFRISRSIWRNFTSRATYHRGIGKILPIVRLRSPAGLLRQHVGTADFRAKNPMARKTETPGPWLDAGQEFAIDRLFARPSGAPGYAVALIEDGEFVFAKGYGLANLDDNIPITPWTSFHLALLSKQFTAAAVALLILDHKIALSDPVAKYPSEVSKYGDALRIAHLRRSHSHFTS
jgi:CubicO group peptidase (beta-lactamase class C family)